MNWDLDLRDEDAYEAPRVLAVSFVLIITLILVVIASCVVIGVFGV